MKFPAHFCSKILRKKLSLHGINRIFSKTMDTSENKIIHIDMDAFFASVEQLDCPDFRGKPIAVGGAGNRGVVAAASYEARKYGVRSAMSGAKARKLCPDLIFVSPRFERYKEISLQIREIFYEYTDLVEPLSLDEAYLDVTFNKKNSPSATNIAKEIRKKIFEKTGLTASAGVSVNKFIAKIASDYKKPNGQTTIKPNKIIPFLDSLDIRKFYGIGKVTAEKMYALGIFTGKDLREKSLPFLQSHFGNSGLYYYEIARGIHRSPVNPVRIAKSIGVEQTFEHDEQHQTHLLTPLDALSKELEQRLKKRNLSGRTITLKIKYSDFTTQTRSKTLAKFVSDQNTLFRIGEELLFQENLKNSVRLLGLSVSNLNVWEKQNQPKYIQLKFEFPPH